MSEQGLGDLPVPRFRSQTERCFSFPILNERIRAALQQLPDDLHMSVACPNHESGCALVVSGIHIGFGIGQQLRYLGVPVLRTGYQGGVAVGVCGVDRRSRANSNSSSKPEEYFPVG